MSKPRGRALGSPLSPQQAQILELVANGATGKDMWELAFITPSTAWAVMANVRAKLGATTNPHAVTIAHRRGLIK